MNAIYGVRLYAVPVGRSCAACRAVLIVDREPRDWDPDRALDAALALEASDYIVRLGMLSLCPMHLEWLRTYLANNGDPAMHYHAAQLT